MNTGAGEVLASRSRKEAVALPTEDNQGSTLPTANQEDRASAREISNARNPVGRPLKALTLTRQRASSCGANTSIRDYLGATGTYKADGKRKRASLQDQGPPTEEARVVDFASTPDRSSKHLRMSTPPKQVTLERLFEEISKLRDENKGTLVKLEQQLTAYQQKNAEGMRELREDLKNIETANNRKWKETEDKLADLEERLGAMRDAPLSEAAEARLSKIEDSVSKLKEAEKQDQTKKQINQLQDLIDS